MGNKYKRLFGAVLFCLFILTIDVRAQLVFIKDVDEFHPNLDAKEIKAEFPFVNTGTTPITIKSISPSCGCTVADSDKKTYAPGEKGVISATYTIHSATGYQEKQIAISTVEDPDSTKILTIKAFIPAIIAFTPSQLRWTVGEASTTKYVHLSLLPDRPIKLIGIEGTSDKVTMTLHSLNQEGAYTISITPLSTDDPLLGIVMIKFLMGNDKTPRLAYYHFSIEQARIPGPLSTSGT